MEIIALFSIGETAYKINKYMIMVHMGVTVIQYSIEIFGNHFHDALQSTHLMHLIYHAGTSVSNVGVFPDLSSLNEGFDSETSF